MRDIPAITCQSTVAADHSSLARRATEANLMVEGWGLYARSRTELGYLDQRHAAVATEDCCGARRALWWTWVFRRGDDVRRGGAYMVERPKLEAPNAIAEVRRTRSRRRNLSLRPRRAAILDLRSRRKPRWGMRLFHDKLLNSGSRRPNCSRATLGWTRDESCERGAARGVSRDERLRSARPRTTRAGDGGRA